MSPAVRLQATAVWDTLTFVFNGLVFVLVGLQLPYVMSQIQGMDRVGLLRYGIGFSVAMIAIRMVWVFGETYSAYAFQIWIKKLPAESPSPATVFIIGWGGMRGVLSLAAAISLPYALPSNRSFQQRNMIIFLTFCLIFATLVVQGLTMPWIIRALGLHRSDQTKTEEQDARRVLLREAIAFLSRRRSKRREHTNLYSEIIVMYQRRLDALPAEQEAEEQSSIDHSERKDALLSVLQVEREALIRLRDEGYINDEVLRTLQRELDLSESRIHTAAVLE